MVVSSNIYEPSGNTKHYRGEDTPSFGTIIFREDSGNNLQNKSHFCQDHSIDIFTSYLHFAANEKQLRIDP